MNNKGVLALSTALSGLALGAGEWSRHHEAALAAQEDARISPELRAEMDRLQEQFRQVCSTIPTEDLLDGNTWSLDKIEEARSRLLNAAGLPDTDWGCHPSFEEVGGVTDFFAAR